MRDADLAEAERALSEGSLEAVEPVCRARLAANTEDARARAVLGLARLRGGDAPEAALHLALAVGCSPRQPRWRAGLATALQRLNRLEEARRHAVEAVRLNPRDPDLLLTLALICADLGDRDGAKALLLGALAQKSDHADAHMALAQSLLAEGDFDAGWVEYEWRNQTQMAKRDLPSVHSARWNGMRLGQGRLLLIADQGFGDMTQFARFIPLTAERAAETLVMAPKPLGALLARLPGVTEVLHDWREVPAHAAHARLSTLPLIFRARAGALCEAPYLKADPELVAAWNARLGPALRVGLAWAGRPEHPNDHRRSTRLATLAPLAEVAGVSFVCLQKPMPAADRPLLGAFRGLSDLSQALTDFDETAALIANLDLVIAVDTGVAHVAAALGKPVWLLLARPCDWRWGTEGETSLWYPSARLFRQPAPGDWDGLVSAARAALERWAPTARG